MITTTPRAPLFDFEDYFGNRIHAFTIGSKHRELRIRTRSIVSTTASGNSTAIHAMTPDEQWKMLSSDAFIDHYAEYLLPSHYTTPTSELSEFARVHFPSPSGTVLAWASTVSKMIHETFVYDPNATTVQTTSDQILHLRRGVCQDFAHFMISVCRHYGVPARYVSGYHFVGDLNGNPANFEHASHAWIEVFAPDAGWMAFDPTNVSDVGERYVKIGHGRDYKDIVPVKGVYRGNGAQSLDVTVKVSVLPA